MPHFVFGFCLSYNSSATWNEQLFVKLTPVWPAQPGHCGRLRADGNGSWAFLPTLGRSQLLANQPPLRGHDWSQPISTTSQEVLRELTAPYRKVVQGEQYF